MHGSLLFKDEWHFNENLISEMYLCHSNEEVGASAHSSDLLHDIWEEVQEEVDDIHPLAFLLAIHLALLTHL